MPLLALSLLAVTFSYAGNPCKQFGSRSGSKLFGTLIVLCKVLFERLILENDDKSMKNYPASVILIPAQHDPASFTHNFVLGCKVFISASPRMQWYCRLGIKNSVLDSYVCN